MSRVRDVLQAKGSEVHTVPPATPVMRVVQQMRVDQIGAYVVSSRVGQLDGIVTERDILYALARRGAGALELPVSAVMSRAPSTCTPDDTVRAMNLDERCAVVALTHDPKLDDLALLEALKSRAFYVGALGSRANNAKRRQRLKDFDLSDDEIARLHGPIGLYIGSRTPPEIAVSILAEITAVKNGVALPEAAKIGAAKERLSPSVACETS